MLTGVADRTTPVRVWGSSRLTRSAHAHDAHDAALPRDEHAREVDAGPDARGARAPLDVLRAGVLVARERAVHHVAEEIEDLDPHVGSARQVVAQVRGSRERIR